MQLEALNSCLTCRMVSFIYQEEEAVAAVEEEEAVAEVSWL